MYLLEPIDFSFQELEPYIDTHTIGLHHLKHHKNYLKELNRLLSKNHFSYSYPIEELYLHIHEFPKEDVNDILFYLGGVLNHDLYFKCISPKNKTMPNEYLQKEIENSFGSLEEFQERFIQYAMNLKGSGYVFLSKTKENKLELETMSNQDNPRMYGNTPLFCVDMWEHAYYLNYQNNKKEYLNTFFELANFSYANKHF